MDPPCSAQFRQVVFFIHPWSELPPFLIASIMSNEREWIEHTLSHAHHEPRGAPPVSTPGLLYDSQQSRGNAGDPRTLPARSLNPSFFPFPTLSPFPLHLPIVIVQTTMAGGAEEEERTEEADITKAISRMAHSMRRACRVCGQFAIAGRLLRFGERLRCCRCWPPQRGTDSAQTPLTSASRFSIPSFGLTRRQISEEGEREVFFAH